MPIKLTDSELDAVMRAARPLSVDRRDAFLQQIAHELSSCGERGPGSVHRAIRSVVRDYFDPPDLGGGGRPGATTKF
jgi:hypothetical protein